MFQSVGLLFILECKLFCSDVKRAHSWREEEKIC